MRIFPNSSENIVNCFFNVWEALCKEICLEGNDVFLLFAKFDAHNENTLIFALVILRAQYSANYDLFYKKSLIWKNIDGKNYRISKSNVWDLLSAENEHWNTVDSCWTLQFFRLRNIYHECYSLLKNKEKCILSEVNAKVPFSISLLFVSNESFKYLPPSSFLG